MASPAVQEKYSLLITGDIDYQAKLMSGIVNGFPQLLDPDSRFNIYFETNQLVKVDGEHVMLEVYKFEERSFNVSFDYHYEYSRANGILILYDVTNEDSLDEVWRCSINIERYLYDEDTRPPIMIVGANIEKREEQVISIERMRMKAEEKSRLKLRYAEVSTVTGENVETVLQTITRDMVAHVDCDTKPEPPKTEHNKKRCVVC